MWFRIPKAVSDASIDNILSRSGAIAEKDEDRHFVKAGKKFFRDNPDLLMAMHSDVAQALGLDRLAPNLAINHAFLLYKSGPGPATRCHQDRPYWTEIEPSCTMFTVWIALADVTDTMGALTLNPANEVDAETFFGGYKDGVLLGHEDDKYGGGGFTITLPDEVAANFAKDFATQPMKRGDLVVFDAFEPHASTDNSESTTRLSMKIVYGDPSSMKDYLVDPNATKLGTILSAFRSRIGL